MRIYEPRGKAREYSPRALNYFKGCDHGCQYCYVPQMMKAFNSNYVHENVSCELKGLTREVERFKKSKDGDQQVLLSFTGDPYCGFENGETREVLCALLDNQCHVSVLTKNPGKAMRDIDIMSDFDYFKLGVTLTCFDGDDSKRWETGAPTGKNRIDWLRKISEMGIKTWVSFEPVLYPEQTLEMIRSVSEFIDHVKIGKINHHPREKEIDWEKFLYEVLDLCRGLNMKFYIKNDLAKFGKSDLFYPVERDQDFLNV